MLLAVGMTLMSPASAQDGEPGELDGLQLPGLSNFASPRSDGPLAQQQLAGEVRLSARLTEDGGEIPHGLVWRVFDPEIGTDGSLPLVASAQGGTSVFNLAPGSYLVHASFGRAGATKRITVGPNSHADTVVLDAGGLKLDATMPGGMRIASDKLRFSIYESAEQGNSDRPLILPNVSPGTVVRLNSGTYHVVSNFGSINAVIRSDLRVEAGKLTEATVEHRAAELTMKLVREKGGEAIADTSWSVLTGSGDVVYESVGAFASMVLAEGNYVAVAKNRERIYQHDFEVVAGRNQSVEVLITQAATTDR